MMKCSAIILAGGKSSRMNYSPKALLEYEEEFFIDREIKALNKFDEILISCNDSRIIEKIKGFTIIEDEIKDIGPIGGIYSALKKIKNEKGIIVSCDMPFLNKEILEMLGKIDFEEDCLIPTLNGRLEPFCGVYKKEIIEKIYESIKEKEYSLRGMFKKLNIKKIEIKDENNFTNINTVEEYDKLVLGNKL